MKNAIKHSCFALCVCAVLGLSGCGGMSQQQKNTGYGAAAGGVAGAVITGGSTVGTLGGAAVGGLIGHEVSSDSDKKKRRK